MAQPTGLFTYSHDPAGRIATLVNPEGQTTSWQYDAASRVTATLMANGTLASNTFDSADQVLLLANLTTGGTTLSSFNYKYNSVGNRTQVVEADGDVLTFSYDPTYQLINEARSGTNSYNISYTYDPVGSRTLSLNNGTPTTSTYNAGNELITCQTSMGVTTSTYDGGGNLLTCVAPGNEWTTNTWDGENRLTRALLPSGIVDSFTYSGDGLRVQKQDSAGTTNHVWDGQNILLETNASDVINVVYTLAPSLYGNLISQSRGMVDSFYFFDALTSVRQLTSTMGLVTDSYLFDSYGNTLLANGATTNSFRFAGRIGYYYDSDLAWYYVRARYLIPALGIFISHDPLARGVDPAVSALSGSPWNRTLYSYVSNNPVSFQDPSGLLSPVVVVSAALICLYGSYCLAFNYASSLLIGGRKPNTPESQCIKQAVSAFGDLGMPNTASCAGSAGIGAKIAGGNAGETPLDSLCACTPYVYLAASTAKCKDCTSIVELVSTLYHECVHTHQCALLTTDKSREQQAYCNEAAFDHVKLLGL